jgi:hypothetical protein
MLPTSTFIPQMRGYIRSPTGYLTTGDAVFGRPKSVGLSVVRIEKATQPTSIRTDKSGSQGRADESVVQGRLLIENRVRPANGDLITIHGTSYEVLDVYPRYDMDGLVNHYQVDIGRWD